MDLLSRHNKFAGNSRNLTGSTVVKSIVFVRQISSASSSYLERLHQLQHKDPRLIPTLRSDTPLTLERQPRFPSLYRESRNVPFDCFECLRIHAVLPTSRFGSGPSLLRWRPILVCIGSQRVVRLYWVSSFRSMRN